MEAIIEILICVFVVTYCIKKIIHDRKIDKANDLRYKQEDSGIFPCETESEHCDYCGTDDCIYHPNNN
jgi:hypothetical protein